MLFAGVAFAQVGSLAPRAPDLSATTSGDVAEGGTLASDSTSAVDTTGVVHVTDGGERALIVDYPASGDRFEGEALTIRGQAPPGWTVQLAQLSTRVGRAGDWDLTVVLAPGENRIPVIAIGPDGTEQLGAELTVHYEVAGSPTITPAGADDALASPAPDESDTDPTFTADQKYAESHTPREVLWGSGSPGDTISAVSLYGDTTTQVDRQGRWDLHLRFGDAPRGTPFDIIVESASGGSASFSFTYLGPEGDGDATRRSQTMAADTRHPNPASAWWDTVTSETSLNAPGWRLIAQYQRRDRRSDGDPGRNEYAGSQIPLPVSENTQPPHPQHPDVRSRDDMGWGLDAHTHSGDQPPGQPRTQPGRQDAREFSPRH
jgi:hypothetical protein